jgi:hypothetical protein
MLPDWRFAHLPSMFYPVWMAGFRAEEEEQARVPLGEVQENFLEKEKASREKGPQVAEMYPRASFLQRLFWC